jgi:hypothetical protein
MKSIDRLNQIKAGLAPNKIIDEAYPVFVKNTPIDTGYARRHTTKNSSEIHANYPYAKRLDQGWSKQSPRGMVEPTIQAIRSYIKKLIG